MSHQQDNEGSLPPSSEVTFLLCACINTRGGRTRRRRKRKVFPYRKRDGLSSLNNESIVPGKGRGSTTVYRKEGEENEIKRENVF